MLLYWVKAAVALIKARVSRYSLLRDWYMNTILLAYMPCMAQVDGSSFSLFESLSLSPSTYTRTLGICIRRGKIRNMKLENQIKHCRDPVRSRRGHMVDIAQTGW